MLKKFGNFDEMISEYLIKGIFWIGIAFWAMEGLFALMFGFGVIVSYGLLAGMAIIVFGLLVGVCGILWVRIVCEAALIRFLIHKNLVTIRDVVNGEQQSNLPLLRR